MPSRGSVAASVRADKEKRPENYCGARGCLWRVVTRNGYSPCRNHPADSKGTHNV